MNALERIDARLARIVGELGSISCGAAPAESMTFRRQAAFDHERWLIAELDAAREERENLLRAAGSGEGARP